VYDINQNSTFLLHTNLTSSRTRLFRSFAWLNSVAGKISCSLNFVLFGVVVLSFLDFLAASFFLVVNQRFETFCRSSHQGVNNPKQKQRRYVKTQNSQHKNSTAVET
jgi:hypothetical protein